jgi:hypothetical protein
MWKSTEMQMQDGVAGAQFGRRCVTQRISSSHFCDFHSIAGLQIGIEGSNKGLEQMNTLSIKNGWYFH